MTPGKRDDARLQELQSGRALGTLDAEEETERGGLLGSTVADESLELAAAAVELASLDVSAPMPGSLRAKLEASARELGGPARPSRLANTRIPYRALFWTGWGVAAAVVLAFIANRPRATSGGEPIASSLATPTVNVVTSASAPGSSATAAVARSQLLARGSAVLRAPWTVTQGAARAAISGDVVWSSSDQLGFMHFHGLPSNDPSASQYQLWIFDETRDPRYPVDGGVFDMPPGSTDLVVPIRPRVKVDKPTLFAITIEKPGGVVVSDRQRIVVTAGAG